MKGLILLSLLSLIVTVLSDNDPQHCFDVLEITPKSELKKFSEMSFKETAKTTLTADIFTCFLEESRYIGGEKSNAEKYYDIYKKSNEYAKYTHQLIGKRELNELIQLGLQNALVNYLNDGIRSRNRIHIKESITYIAEKMEEYIEKSPEYINYQKFILQQLEGEKIIKVKPVGGDQGNDFKYVKEKSNDEHNLVEALAFSKNSGQKSSFIDISYIKLLQYFCLLTILIFL